MAKSKYEYVKGFERSDALLPNTWIVVRVDGRAFSKFTKDHGFAKPIDTRGIDLMNACAMRCLDEFADIFVGYGHSDEFSFVLRREATMFKRRESKIVTSITSFLSAAFVFLWKDHFPDTPLLTIPQFDGRCVLYPDIKSLRDYMSWRQVDCHINNLYNTCFWALVQQGNKTENEAKEILSPTNSGHKNNMLFSDFGINYNNLPAMFRKGSIALREPTNIVTSKVDSRSGELVTVTRTRNRPVVKHVDYIKCTFWEEHQQQLGVCLVMPKAVPLVGGGSGAGAGKSEAAAANGKQTKTTR